MANTNPLPPLPQIGGDSDLLLDVFTHSSLRPALPPGHTMNEEYGNTDRLAELGAMALDLVITNHFYLLRPMMSGRVMRERMNEATSDTNIDRWLTVYRMKERFQVAPGATDVYNDPAEMRKYFYSFVGAIVIRNGLSEPETAIQAWISALIQWSAATAAASANIVEQPANAIGDGQG